MSPVFCFVFCSLFFFLQQARELVVKLIRDKDQGDFRVGRAEFGSKMGGSSLDVRLSPQFALIMMIGCRFKKNKTERNKILLFAQVVVPRFAVGIIIGRNGEMIKKIQNDAGVRIQFKQGKRRLLKFSTSPLRRWK